MGKCIVWAFLLWAAPASSQTTEPRIDGLLNPSQLTSTFIFWGNQLLVVMPDTISKKKVIRAYHSPLSPDMRSAPEYDNDILDGETLRPLYKHTPNGSVIYDYSSVGKIKISFITTIDTVVREVQANKPTYNLTGPSAGLLTAAMPLKPGFSAVFSELNLRFPYAKSYETIIRDYTIKVTGEETVTVNAKEFHCYIVEIISAEENGGLYYKSWVTKRAPHHAIQFIYTSKKAGKDYSKIARYSIRDIFFAL